VVNEAALDGDTLGTADVDQVLARPAYLEIPQGEEVRAVIDVDGVGEAVLAVEHEALDGYVRMVHLQHPSAHSDDGGAAGSLGAKANRRIRHSAANGDERFCVCSRPDVDRVPRLRLRKPVLNSAEGSCAGSGSCTTCRNEPVCRCRRISGAGEHGRREQTHDQCLESHGDHPDCEHTATRTGSTRLHSPFVCTNGGQSRFITSYREREVLVVANEESNAPAIHDGRGSLTTTSHYARGLQKDALFVVEICAIQVRTLRGH
jgi:hypothetical protein